MMGVPRVIIDHGALRHNLRRVRHYAPRSRVLAVIKANAYGHGMLEVAHSLSEADGFAVARLEEGIRLREASIRKPILILGGVQSGGELVAAARHALELVVHEPGQIALLEREPLSPPPRIWLKVDTGMHRLGILPEAVPEALARLRACGAVQGPPRLLTHLANADTPEDPLTEHQCQTLRRLAGSEGGELCIGNSAGLVAFPASRTHWVRPGIMLYGASPFAHTSAADHGLRPVMTLRSALIAVRRCRRGDPVGYGGTYVCPEDMPVGVAAMGYGDGYPRQAPSGTPVLVRGHRVPLIGRVSMDLISLDLRGLPQAQVGDPVTLWGEDLPVDEVARAAGTIAYELLCRLGPRAIGVEHRNRGAEPAENGGLADGE